MAKTKKQTKSSKVESSAPPARKTLPALPKPYLEALVSFWSRYMKARNRYYRELEIGGDYGLWLVFLETKNQYRRELACKVPEVFKMGDLFWRYVQDLKPEEMEWAIKGLKYAN